MKIDFSKYQVIIKPKDEMNGWWAMNHEAAKALGFKPIPKRYTLFISDNISKENRPLVERHEIIECELMDHEDMTYKQGHAIANKLEKFTHKQINEKIEEYIK